MANTIIFLGPSLNHGQAKEILPDAYYLPPVRCGDILRAMRLKPKTIAIIDGYFENTPAVWHKEILFALEKGITVIGSSSMGALRASELQLFGMQSVGVIAEDFRLGVLNDDDEVALLHNPAHSGFNPLTDAMVNIRTTLTEAFAQHIIDNNTKELLLNTAKQLFYSERNLGNVINNVKNKYPDVALDRLITWLEKANFQDRKKQDAILLLESLRDGMPSPLSPLMQTKEGKKITVNRSAFFRSLHKQVMCRPFTQYHDWLPMPEKVALAARYLGPNYRLVRRVAYLLSACYSLAIKQHIAVTHEQKQQLFSDDIFDLCQLDIAAQWSADNDCTVEEKAALSERIAIIYALIAQEKASEDFTTTSDDYLFMLLHLSDDYLKYKQLQTSQVSLLEQFKLHDPQKYRLMHLISLCWWVVERQALRLELQPIESDLQLQSDKFRIKRNLQSQATTEQWLADHDMDLERYQYFMIALSRLNFLVLQNNLDIFGTTYMDENTWWLLDALRLSGLYQQAKEILNQPEKMSLVLLVQPKDETLQDYAFSLDFLDGAQELQQALNGKI